MRTCLQFQQIAQQTAIEQGMLLGLLLEVEAAQYFLFLLRILVLQVTNQSRGQALEEGYSMNTVDKMLSRASTCVTWNLVIS